ncbi:DNA repair protein XRCC3 homolog [Chenopodium quinoa]|uniref:DNA repair protein XRCC3 homolog n=1 Tax=Chenopodium quinoa TaxID=63459 RepID=UPI000B7792BC|nr:DNA repair protein XRCC3 homolog [Chenopodium quinoa]
MLAAQLAPSLWGLGCSSVYIQSIGLFPSARMNGIIPHVFGSPPTQGQHPLETVLVKKVDSPHNLVETVQWLETFLQSPIGTLGHYRVVVIDSISSICHFHFTNTRESMMERTAIVKVVSNGLRLLAKKYDLVVVAVNDVIEVSQYEYNSGSNMIMSNGRKVRPAALGKFWSNNISTRIFLSKTYNNSTGGWDRTISLLSSPVLENDGCSFIISNAGVVDV